MIFLEKHGETITASVHRRAPLLADCNRICMSTNLCFSLGKFSIVADYRGHHLDVCTTRPGRQKKSSKWKQQKNNDLIFNVFQLPVKHNCTHTQCAETTTTHAATYAGRSNITLEECWSVRLLWTSESESEEWKRRTPERRHWQWKRDKRWWRVFW